MNETSKKRLATLMPEFAAKVSTVVAAVVARGFVIEITQALRTFAEQQILWEQGRLRAGPIVTNAKGGQSYHNYALATDFALIVKGKYTWPDPHPVWLAIAQEAEAVGLEAGYRWPRKPDKPHVQWPRLEAMGGWRKLRSIYLKNGITDVWDYVVLQK